MWKNLIYGLFVFSSLALVTACDLEGDDGDPGIEGIQGIEGEAGLQGPVGPTGATGSQGETGLQGSVGPTGATGLQGETGLQGPIGLTGATGLQGEVGPPVDYRPWHGLHGGLISTTDIENCLVNEDGYSCELATAIVVQASPGLLTAIDVVQAYTIQVDGEPVLVERIINIGITTSLLNGGPNYESQFYLALGEDNLTFKLSQDQPFFSFDDSNLHLRFKVASLANHQFMLTMGNVASVKQISTESLGIIETVGGSVVGDKYHLLVDIQNFGDLKTNYVLTVFEDVDSGLCAYPPRVQIDSVWAQAVILAPAESAQLQFELSNSSGDYSSLGDLCIRLSSPTGRVYDLGSFSP